MSTERPRVRWRLWLLVWAGWTTLAVVFAASTSLTYISQNRAPLWGPVLAVTLAQWWIWAALTPVVLWIARRFALERGRLLARVPIHFVFGVLVAFVKLAIEGRVREWVFGAPPYLLISNLVLQYLIYAALVAAAHLVARYGQTQARAAAVESRLNEARVQLLRAQLQPHFLFNALNAIAELVHEDPDRADVMIGRLSDLLRATVGLDARQDVTLDEELVLVEAYLEIQRARFGDRLVVSIEVEASCRALLVPHLLLQPLVENAVEHGTSRRADGGTLSVAAERRDRVLEIRVEDDGPGWEGDEPAAGVGLTNTRARLAVLYGAAGRLTLTRRQTRGVRATVTLPAATAREEDA
jgi:signal transduction histidine kinase